MQNLTMRRIMLPPANLLSQLIFKRGNLDIKMLFAKYETVDNTAI